MECETLINGTNTEPVPNDVFVFGDVYNYTCMEHYTTTNETSTYCQANGTWTLDVPPTCTRKSR